MSRLRRFLLGVATLAAPVLVAACYGPPMGYMRTGRVIDPVTRKGISHVQVSCNGRTVETADDGGYVIEARACQDLVFTDTAGAHQAVTKPVDAVPGELEMPPATAPATAP
jgi:hypothetical protein